MNLQLQVSEDLSVLARNKSHLDYMCRAVDKLGPTAVVCLYASRNFLCSLTMELPLGHPRAVSVHELVDKIDRLIGLTVPGNMQ